MTAFLVGGCGLIIGLEDRELPADGADASADSTTTEGSTSTDGAADTSTTPDSGGDAASDAGDAGDAEGGDACTCTAGCNPDGQCLDEIVSIGVGRFHQCIVRGDGKLFCIGGNEFLQLATNAVVLSETWVPVVVNNVLFREVAVGPMSNCAIARDGDLYCWGKNDLSQLAQPANVAISTPTKVNLGGLKVKAVSVGHQATCAIVDVAAPDPNIRCWGHSSSGDLGVGFDTTDGGDAGPYPIATPQTASLRAKSIHVLGGDVEGVGRACVISETNLPYCWGGAQNSEIVDPIPTSTCDPTGASPFACLLGPTAWGAVASRDIGNGKDDVCAIELGADAGDASVNHIRCRGSVGSFYLDNQCASPDAGYEITIPDGGGSPVRLGSSFAARCFVNDAADVWCFGSNGSFQAAREGSDPCVDAGSIPPDRRPSEPLRVTFFPDGGGPDAGEGPPIKAKLLAVGRHSVVVYTTDRRLVGWGANQQGELGTRPPSSADTSSCFGVDGRCQGPTVIPPPAYP